MAIRFSLLTILLFLLVSCGARDQYGSQVFLAGQVLSGMPIEYEARLGLISSLKRKDLFMDTDKDKVLDRDDFDIDNDGVPNDCDHAPFAKGLGNQDSDNDGIPDFCDQNHPIQSEFIRKYGVLLNLNELNDLSFDLEELRNITSYISTRTTMPSHNLVTLTLTQGLPYGEYGVYDKDWKNIRYMPNRSSHEEFPWILSSSWTLIHEYFHFAAVSNKKEFEEFVKNYEKQKKEKVLPWPTEYSKVSIHEYFAEIETSKYFGINF